MENFIFVQSVQFMFHYFSKKTRVDLELLGNIESTNSKKNKKQRIHKEKLT